MTDETPNVADLHEADGHTDGQPHQDGPLVVTETVHYADGTSATGVAPLPMTSPMGAPRVPAPEVGSGVTSSAAYGYDREAMLVEQGAYPMAEAKALPFEAQTQQGLTEHEPYSDAHPRPIPPPVSIDHMTVVDYLHDVINHLRAELIALGVHVEP